MFIIFVWKCSSALETPNHAAGSAEGQLQSLNFAFGKLNLLMTPMASGWVFSAFGEPKNGWLVGWLNWLVGWLVGLLVCLLLFCHLLLFKRCFSFGKLIFFNIKDFSRSMSSFFGGV